MNIILVLIAEVSNSVAFTGLVTVGGCLGLGLLARQPGLIDLNSRIVESFRQHQMSVVRCCFLWTANDLPRQFHLSKHQQSKVPATNPHTLLLDIVDPTRMVSTKYSRELQLPKAAPVIRVVESGQLRSSFLGRPVGVVESLLGQFQEVRILVVPCRLWQIWQMIGYSRPHMVLRMYIFVFDKKSFVIVGGWRIHK